MEQLDVRKRNLTEPKLLVRCLLQEKFYLLLKLKERQSKVFLCYCYRQSNCNKESEGTKFKTSVGMNTSTRDLVTESRINTVDEENLAWNFIVFNYLPCNYGKDMDVATHYHYSDIKTRNFKSKSKTLLDAMPIVPCLRHLKSDYIPFKKVKKLKFSDSISYTEEIAGSVKTVYSSESDDRFDDYMSEAAMIEKVSIFLSEASIDTPPSENKLESSMHDHDQSLRFENFDSFLNSRLDKCRQDPLCKTHKRVMTASLFGSKSVSARNKFYSSFANTPVKF